MTTLHDQLDAVIAYGWVPGLSVQETLEQLAQLGEVRQQEEKAGLVRYLRLEYQDPRGTQQHDLGIEVSAPDAITDALLTFPTRLAEQAQVVWQVLQDVGRQLSAGNITARFRAGRSDRGEEIVEMLVELGQARQLGEQVVAYAA